MSLFPMRKSAAFAPVVAASLESALLGAALLGVTACRRPPSASAPLSKPPSESALGRVVLSAEAEQRLGIPPGLTPLALRRQPGQRLLRGEVMAAPGAAAWVIAPQAGIVQPLAGAALPQAGTRVQAGQPLAWLLASLAPTERAQVSTVQVDAEAQVARAQVQDAASELALRRAERLLAEEAVAARVVEDARAQRELARAALQAALTQRGAIAGPGRASGSAKSAGALAQLPLLSPLTGRLRELRVAAAQQVLAGAPLFDVIADEPLWVRVAVPAGELVGLPADAAAQIEDLATPAAARSVSATPAKAAPLSAQPQQATVDRYFVLPPSAPFFPGQAVAAWLSQRQPEETPTVPAAALLYDPSGGTWLYEQAAPQTFLRRRVEVLRIAEGLAFLSPRSLPPGGLAVGAAVVTAGAIELYGAEFGSGK